MSPQVSPWTHSKVPGGRRVYAVGDVHGRRDLLDALLEKIERHCREDPPEAITLVCLGDYVDRGPSSKEVVDRLAHGLPSGFQAVLLRGNHEHMLLSFLHDPYSGLRWLKNGGDATLLSYGVPQWTVRNALRHPEALPEAAHAFRAALSSDHLLFYRSLALYHREGDYFFVHAGVRPGRALDEQHEHDLLWIRDEFLDWPADYGAVVVHGHTPARFQEDKRNRIGIDTYAFASGRLTAVVLEGAERRFITS